MGSVPGSAAIAAGTVMLLLATAAQAALPPQHQRVREFEAVMAAATDVLDFQVIDSVTFVDVDLYAVRSGTCTLEVRIVGRPMPEGMVGARQFDAVPGALDCK